MDVTERVVWRRLDEPGHEACRLRTSPDGWELAGTAIFVAGGNPVHLAYSVRCDRQWRTVRGSVCGWIGMSAVDLQIEVDDARRWRVNGTPRPDVQGCIDLDLNFTPATNLLQIRRLPLPMNEAVTVRTAWLSFPDLTLRLLEQVYRRTGAHTFAYRSPSLDFSAELTTNDAGFVIEYPPLWTAERLS
jgi:hypothetical protein